MNGRPLLHGAKSARAARRDYRTRRPQLFEPRAVCLWRCWCDRASADGIAPRWPTSQPAKSALRGACAQWAAGRYCTGQKSRGPRATEFKCRAMAIRRQCRRSIAALVEPRLSRRSGEERAPRWPTTRPWQVRTARRAYRATRRGPVTGTGFPPPIPRKYGDPAG